MGLLHSFIKQTWPPASRFSVEDIPDLTGKVIIVTGGNAGMGYETAKVRHIQSDSNDTRYSIRLS